MAENDLTIWAKKNDIGIMNKITENREPIMELSVIWIEILKIGHILILKKPIEDYTEASNKLPTLKQIRQFI